MMPSPWENLYFKVWITAIKLLWSFQTSQEKNFKGSRKDWLWVSINFKDQTSAEEIEIYDDNSEEEYHCSNANNIVSSPLKLRGGLVFEIWTERGIMKKLLRNRGLVERGNPLRKRKVSKLFHQFSFRKACFRYY